MARPMSLDDAAACPSCGRLPEPEDKFCEACGSMLQRPAVNGSVRANRDSTEFDLGFAAGVSDRGLRHRRNEDVMALAATQLPCGPAAVAVVCDGVSGSPSPDAAARAAARALAGALMSGLCNSEDPVRTAASAVGVAREELVSLALTRHASADDAPATTFVTATLTRRAITLCWLGDSRAYWLSAEPRAAQRLTTDDSVAADMVAARRGEPAHRLRAHRRRDGQRDGGPRAVSAGLDLSLAIKLCEGAFGCDCRGVGTDWEVGELRRISTALFGTVDIVPDPAGLAADFAGMMGKAMANRVADVSLRIWMPQHASVRFVKQVAPRVDDLTGRAEPSGPQIADYPTGAWGDGESRDYHVCVRVTPGAVGQQMLAARVSVVVGSPSSPEVLGQGLLRAVWTEDEALSTWLSRHVAHYTGQAELARVIQEGLEARKRGDEGNATAKLGRAVALAEQSGNLDTAKLLAKVVDVVDAPTGTVRLKKKVHDADEMALDTRSTRTVRTRK